MKKTKFIETNVTQRYKTISGTTKIKQPKRFFVTSIITKKDEKKCQR